VVSAVKQRLLLLGVGAGSGVAGLVAACGID
jgi:hypothetical protein